MKRLGNLLAITLVITLGGIIGYTNAPNQNLQANEITRIRWVDVPKTDVSKPNFININLQEEKIDIEADEPTSVTVYTEVKEVPVYRTKTVEKPVYQLDIIQSTKLFKKLAPLTLPKITVDRK